MIQTTRTLDYMLSGYVDDYQDKFTHMYLSVVRWHNTTLSLCGENKLDQDAYELVFLNLTDFILSPDW